MNITLTPFLANFMGPQGLVIMVFLLLMFGAKRLPELAKGLGQAIREFSKAKNDISEEIMRESASAPARQIEPQVAQTPPPAGTQAVGSQPTSAPQTTETHV